MARTTIRVNGGKEYAMDEKGDIPEEGKAELARAIGSTLGKMVSPLGHNSSEAPKTQDELSDKAKRFTRAGGVAVDQLKSIIGRVEKLEEEKAGIAADIREIFAEAKGNGFDVKAIRTIIKMRKKDAAEREEEESILETYMNALGMLPLFESQ
jgi:uncharacterized protein (UPF0335 family)